MQTIEIKSGTSATISITPKINGMEATQEQLQGVNVYVFLIYQFTDKIFKTYKLSADNLSVTLTPKTTIEMLGNAEKNQKYEVQFAIKNLEGDVIAEDNDSNLVINITRWEAGIWLNQESAESE